MTQMRADIGIVLKHVIGGAYKVNAVNYLTKPPQPEDKYYYKGDTYVVNVKKRGF